MGNASFNVDFEFVNGVQTVSQYSVTEFEPFWVPRQGADVFFMVPVSWVN